MSWDVLFAPSKPFGPRSDVIARIRARLPNVDFSDPAWGRYRTDQFSIELNLGEEPVSSSLMLHVRGDDAALATVREISEALDCGAFDCTTGELIEFDGPNAGEGLKRWRGFRDEVLGRPRLRRVK